MLFYFSLTGLCSHICDKTRLFKQLTSPDLYFRGADLAALVREASIAALKQAISAGTGHGDIRVSRQHFDMAFTKVKPSVSAKVSQNFETINSKPASHIFCCLLLSSASVLRPRLGPEVIKLFSCSTQLSTKFQMLIKAKIQTNVDVSFFKPLRCCLYHANKC